MSMKTLFLCALLNSALIFTLHGQSNVKAEPNHYRIHPPKGLDFWIVTATGDAAATASIFRLNEKMMKDIAETPGTIKLEGGTLVETRGPKSASNGMIFVAVIEGPLRGNGGWISPAMLQITPESEEVREANQAELDAKIDAVMKTCSSIYKRTIGKKVSDLTVKEVSMIDSCKKLSLYHPESE